MKTLNKRRSIGLCFLSISLPILSLLCAGDAQAGDLYAGTSDPGIVYAYDGTSWTAISETLDWAVLDLIEFQGDLYAATMDSRGKVYRYEGGTTWTLVWTTPSDEEYQVCDLEVWNGDLYAGTAWDNPGGRLYRYDADNDTFDYVGIVPDTDSEGNYHTWRGIRSMYPWSQTGDLHLGDHGYDCFGRYDGTNMIHDAYMGGSCIFDFAEFDGKLYAAAYYGRLFWSSTGVGHDWDDEDFMYENIWELEPFQGYLYMSDGYYSYEGTLSRLDTDHDYEEVWETDSGIISMVADGNSVLYFGTGGEAGYEEETSGDALVYAYDGSDDDPVEIFDADGGDTDEDHAGVQCLYLHLPSVIPVAVDIKPQSCPNPLNVKSRGILPVAILGSEDFDVGMIDVATIRLADVAPIRSSYEDVAAPVIDGQECECTTEGPDGYLDLTLKFRTQDIVDALGEVVNSETLVLTLTGELSDETSIEGADCIRVIKKAKKE